MANPRSKRVHVGAAWRLLFRDLGLDERAILRRARLPQTLFEGKGTSLSLDDAYALHAAVDAEADDSTIALRAGQIVSLELFDPAMFAAICSPDMRTAATRLGAFKRLVGPFTLDVADVPEGMRVGYRCKHRPDLPLTRALTEVVFLVAFARRATRHHVVPIAVAVPSLPTELAAYAAFLGVELTPSEGCSVTFAEADAARPFLTHNAPMWAALEPVLQRRMANADAELSVSERIETALVELLPSGRTQLRDVGKALAMGTRTLQRRLSAEQTTWLTVLNQTRARLARHHLMTSEMSPAEVSFLLGFEDTNSFFRAFRRWTGTTPEGWRADQRAVG